MEDFKLEAKCWCCGHDGYVGPHAYSPGDYIVRCGSSGDNCFFFPSSGPIDKKDISKYNETWNNHISPWVKVEPGKHPIESGKYALSFKDGKMGIFDITVEDDDDWEDDQGNPKTVEVARCYVPWLGSIMIGEDLCVTHYMLVSIPEK